MSPRSVRFERLTNLLLVLLDTSRPLSLREIGTTVAGYPSTTDALRQAFERDKRTLRDGGIPVTVERIDGEEQSGYRIIPEDYYLPDLGLSGAEVEALAFALAAVRLEGGVGAEALAKLGSPALPDLSPVAVLPSLPALGPVHLAVVSRAVLSFSYHGRKRELEPYCLVFRSGSWYVFGLDRTVGQGGAQRTFRVDRFEGAPVPGRPGAFEVPASFDPATVLGSVPFAPAPPGPAIPGAPAPEAGPAGIEVEPARVDAGPAEVGPAVADAAEVVELEVDARDVAALRAQLGRTARVVTTARGEACFSFAVGDEAAFVSWVLGFGDSVMLRSPARLRDAVIDALERAASAPTSPTRPTPPARSPAASTPPLEGPPLAPRQAPVRQPHVLEAGARLRRLLALLAHLAQVGEASVDELARRFSMDPRSLVAELELAACCGLPPYTPDELLELVVDDDRVVAHGLGALHRPPRLTPEEGFAVAAAARALLAVGGSDASGALAAALAKLEVALGSDRMRVEIAEPPGTGTLRRAAAAGELVEIDYLGTRRGGESTRTVAPFRVVAREGQWYLDAYCPGDEQWRRFAVDRVAGVRPTGTSVLVPPIPTAFDGPRAFVPGPSSVRVMVALPEGRQALLDKLADGPAEGLEDGRRAVPLLVGDASWLGRLVLSLGPGTEVLTGPDELRFAPAEVAASVLARYRGAGTT